MVARVRAGKSLGVNYETGTQLCDDVLDISAIVRCIARLGVGRFESGDEETCHVLYPVAMT